MLWLGYHRISYIGKRADTPVSEGEYREAVSRFAAANRYEVELLPVERDQTGSKLGRPILESAIKRIESGEAAGLSVVRWNRLSRATVSDTHLIVERIERAGGKVRAVFEDFPDTPEGRMARNTSFGVSRMEWERAAASTRASKIRAVEQGVWPFTSPPPGYAVKRKRDGGDGKLHRDHPREVARVRAAFKAKAAGAPLTEVAERLGVGFSHASKILSNRAYLGEIRLRFRDGEEIVNPTAHEAIIDRATWEAAQVRNPRPPRNGGPPALLAGLVRCGSCGGSMTPSADGYGSRQYRCMGLPRANGKRCKREAIISQKKLDAYVEGLVLPHIATISTEASARTGEVERLELALEAAEAELGDYLADRELREAVGRDRHLAGARERREKIDQLTGDLVRARATVPEVPDVPDLGELYASWPVEKRAHLLRGALSAVVVAKGRGPCHERVRVVASGFDADDPEGQLGPLSAEQL